jgi:RNA ligase (TIGR02306 family)
MRKLATIRKINKVRYIPDADKICAYMVDGWQVVDQVGKYKVGDEVVYLETDSWIPHELAPFLSKGREPREYKGVKGERLRSVRLKNTLSQGLLLPLSVLTDKTTGLMYQEEDITTFLGVQLWEQEVPLVLRALAKGNFPSFVRKTNQERVQNLTSKYSEFKDKVFEVTEKLEGSSLTVFYNNGEFGFCSRNLELKETEGNTFWKAVKKYYMHENMTDMGLNIAIQGELVGAGIQGNIYDIPDFDYYVYDVFDIDAQKYMSARDRCSVADSLSLKHVPILCTECSLPDTVEALVVSADGKSTLNSKQSREGLVMKATDGSFSFKIISNEYLMKEKE